MADFEPDTDQSREMANNDLYAHLGSGFPNGSIQHAEYAEGLYQELNDMPGASRSTDAGPDEATDFQCQPLIINTEQGQGFPGTTAPYLCVPPDPPGPDLPHIPAAADRLCNYFHQDGTRYVADIAPGQFNAAYYMVENGSCSSRDRSLLYAERSPQSSQVESLPSPNTKWDESSTVSYEYATSDVHSDQGGEPPFPSTSSRDYNRRGDNPFTPCLEVSSQGSNSIAGAETPMFHRSAFPFTPHSPIGNIGSRNFPSDYTSPIATEQSMLGEGYVPSLDSFSSARHNASFVNQTSSLAYGDGAHNGGQYLQQNMSPSSSNIPATPFPFIPGDAGAVTGHLTVPSTHRSRSNSESGMPHPHPGPMMARSASQSHHSHRRRRSSNQASSSGRRPVRDSHPAVESPVAPLERGKRKGNLPQGVKDDALQRRKNKDTCITCKLSRVRCERSRESDLCKGCAHPKRRTLIHAECTRADFKEFVQEGTTNYIGQYSMRHLRWNDFYQHRIDVPEELNIPSLLTDIDAIRGNYDIVRVFQDSDVLYELDFNQVHAYLSCFRTRQKETYAFRHFIDKVLTKRDKWSDCIKQQDPTRSLFKFLYLWDNTPSRQSFELVSTFSLTQQPLDPENVDHQWIYDLITILLRIFGRKLEIAAYDELASNLASSLSGSEVMESLGDMLLSLRWRICWWKLLRDGLHHAQRPREDLNLGITRVNSLCKVLYMWYTFSLNKRLTSECPPLLSGRYSWYEDMPPGEDVYEEFPTEESSEGYHRWMKQGEATIVSTGVRERLKTMPLV